MQNHAYYQDYATNDICIDLWFICKVLQEQVNKTGDQQNNNTVKDPSFMLIIFDITSENQIEVHIENKIINVVDDPVIVKYWT